MAPKFTCAWLSFLLFSYSFIIILKVMVDLNMQNIQTLINIYMHGISVSIATTVNLV